jgi:hypothetical protein
VAFQLRRFEAQRSISRGYEIRSVIADQDKRGAAAAVRDSDRFLRLCAPRGFHVLPSPMAVYRMVRFLYHYDLMDDFIRVRADCQTRFPAIHRQA